jgi:hypothetical protein
MGDSKHPRPGLHGSAPAKPAGAPDRLGAPSTATNAPQPPATGSTDKKSHEERSNPLWNWVKEAGRVAIDSTSRLLRKLEAPELKIEDTKDEELRIAPDDDPGGGYDPYNQHVKPRGPQRK